MPNWCNNNVTISHSDPAKIEALAAAVREGKFCNFVKPVPESLHIVAGRVGDSTDPKQIELEAQEQANLETHGYATWYDFCVNEWSTKWDVDSYEGENTQVENGVLEFGFDSAWSPPIGIYEALVDQGYAVIAYYNEPGMGFVGKWDNGVDDCVEYHGQTSDTVRDYIGEELDDMYAISESMAEYEDFENQEIDLDGGASATNEQVKD
jgi:hypothetical protein